jgi:hypothetical protein
MSDKGEGDAAGVSRRRAAGPRTAGAPLSLLQRGGFAVTAYELSPLRGGREFVSLTVVPFYEVRSPYEGLRSRRVRRADSTLSRP